MSTSGNTSSSTEIFTDTDEVTPFLVNYDLDSNELIGNVEEETDLDKNKRVTFNTQRTFLRNVRNSKRRKS